MSKELIDKINSLGEEAQSNGDHAAASVLFHLCGALQMGAENDLYKIVTQFSITTLIPKCEQSIQDIKTRKN